MRRTIINPNAGLVDARADMSTGPTAARSYQG